MFSFYLKPLRFSRIAEIEQHREHSNCWNYCIEKRDESIIKARNIIDTMQCFRIMIFVIDILREIAFIILNDIIILSQIKLSY